jgi:hypothetical protein
MTLLIDPYRFASAVSLPPTDIVWPGTHSAVEDAPLGTVIGGTLSFVDPDVGATGTFSLANDANGLFGISGTNVIITGVLDYETVTSHNITIRITDNAGLTYDEVFAVTVTDIDETPPPNPPPEGEIVDDGSFINPPVVTEVDDAIKVHGKKDGSTGKFLYEFGPPVAGMRYTVQYDPDFTLMTLQGKKAMIGFGFKHQNDFHIVGLKGDGSTGLNAYAVYGANLWNKDVGFSINDAGPAAFGTQAGPNLIQLHISADGLTYTLRTSGDGSTWTDEYTNVPLPPFDDVSEPTQFGIAGFFDETDTGSFSVAITVWHDLAVRPLGGIWPYATPLPYVIFRRS